MVSKMMKDAASRQIRSFEVTEKVGSRLMPVKRLFDPEKVDLDQVVVSREEIEKIIPHRHEFQQLTRVCYFNPDEKIIVGVRDLVEDEFWVRGYMPGSPIFPGVLMLEVAAQLCGIYKAFAGIAGFLAFGGADNVRFRKMLTIGDRFVVVARAVTISRRRSRFHTQGLSDGEVAFEATMFGIALSDPK